MILASSRFLPLVEMTKVGIFQRFLYVNNIAIVNLLLFHGILRKESCRSLSC